MNYPDSPSSLRTRSSLNSARSRSSNEIRLPPVVARKGATAAAITTTDAVDAVDADYSADTRAATAGFFAHLSEPTLPERAASFRTRLPGSFRIITTAATDNATDVDVADDVADATGGSVSSAHSRTPKSAMQYSVGGNPMMPRSINSPAQVLQDEASVCSAATDGLVASKLTNMDVLMHHPIGAGFLFRFCESQYCSENIRFIMEIDSYRDLFLCDTRNNNNSNSNRSSNNSNNSSIRSGGKLSKQQQQQQQQQSDFSVLGWKALDAQTGIDSTATAAATTATTTTATATADFQRLIEAAAQWYSSQRQQAESVTPKSAAAAANAAINATTATAAGAVVSTTTLSAAAVELQENSSAEYLWTAATEENSTDLYDYNHHSNSSNSNQKVQHQQQFCPGQLVPQETWPLRSCADRLLVEQRVALIWADFISNSADSQICLSSPVLHRTLRRLQLLHLYGSEAFQEALLDPAKTILRDIRPRFLASEELRELRARVEDLTDTPCASALRLPRPPSTLHLRYSRAQVSQPQFRFPLSDVTGDVTLYDDFLKFLVRIVCSENLRFLRAVHVFKELMATTTTSAVDTSPHNHNYNNNSSSSSSSNSNGNNKYKDNNSNSIRSHSNHNSTNNSNNNNSSSSNNNNNNNSSSRRREGYEWAWRIFRFFLNPNAAFEVSLSHRERHALMRQLATPHLLMFSHVEKKTWQLLQQHYDCYCADANRYTLLKKKAIDSINSAAGTTAAATAGAVNGSSSSSGGGDDRRGRSGRAKSCFGF